jgi:tetratricopeptide (TPR) repeat protein
MAQTTLREYLQMTEDAINSGRVSEAFASCQYVLAQFPELLEARRLLGEVYLKQSQLEEAQQTFDWVLINDPENVVAYCSRALICERLKDYDTALDCYQQAYELSRGISHIRQEFNQLSERVGQPGFIFSRAGLARLYMRGDLLPQAIQEWESVLASAPDRLDARTGLLETYWRENMYDRVEQLARQILSSVPHCLKALILLAHVTFAQNALQAQELLQQAKALDPDLIIARELFSDFMVSHPKDPFLTLLKQPPAVLVEEEKQPEPQPVAVQIGQPSQVLAETNGTRGATSTFSDSLGRWSSLDNIIEPQQDYQSLQGASPFGNWGSHTPSDPATWDSSSAQATDTLEQATATAEKSPSPAPADRRQQAEDRANGDPSVLPEHRFSSPGDNTFEGPAADNWGSVLPPMEAGSHSTCLARHADQGGTSSSSRNSGRPG